MGWSVISKCSIEFPKGTPNSIFDKVREFLKADDDFYLITDFPYMIYFEISGNKVVNYDKVKEIQNKALEFLDECSITKEGFTIQCNEFTEAHDGYFFEYEITIEEIIKKLGQAEYDSLYEFANEIVHEIGYNGKALDHEVAYERLKKDFPKIEKNVLLKVLFFAEEKN